MRTFSLKMEVRRLKRDLFGMGACCGCEAILSCGAPSARVTIVVVPLKIIDLIGSVNFLLSLCFIIKLLMFNCINDDYFYGEVKVILVLLEVG